MVDWVHGMACHGKAKVGAGSSWIYSKTIAGVAGQDGQLMNDWEECASFLNTTKNGSRKEQWVVVAVSSGLAYRP